MSPGCNIYSYMHWLVHNTDKIMYKTNTKTQISKKNRWLDGNCIYIYNIYAACTPPHAIFINPLTCTLYVYIFGHCQIKHTSCCRDWSIWSTFSRVSMAIEVFKSWDGEHSNWVSWLSAQTDMESVTIMTFSPLGMATSEPRVMGHGHGHGIVWFCKVL